MKKQEKIEKLMTLSASDFEGDVTGIIGLLKSFNTDGKYLRIDLEHDYDYEYYSDDRHSVFYVNGVREETDEEFEKRKIAANKTKASRRKATIEQKKQQEIEEKEKLKKLLKKYPEVIEEIK